MGYRANGPWPLYIIWVIVFIAVALISLSFETESTRFHGIAETREIVVNSESAVEIKRINIVEGQSIQKGQLIVELSSPELTLKINEISHQLDQLKAQKGIDKAELQAKISQLEAQKASRKNEIANQIRQLENQYNLNKALTSGLKSLQDGADRHPSAASNPLVLEIDSLQQELSLSLHPINIQIELLQKALDASDSPLKIQVEQLERELALLKLESSKLNIYAQISGIIGSVNFKAGEKAAPFAPILTLHTKTPSFIKGYIYENVYTRISMGKTVEVASLTDTRSRTRGVVVGVGARIVEYPIRLRKHPDFQVWGREVVIKISDNNAFILGEKVLINIDQGKASLFDRIARVCVPKETHAQDQSTDLLKIPLKATHPNEILKPIIPLHSKKVEASAVLYLPDMNQYLVLSDETPKRKPLLLLMDQDGRIVQETLIHGLEKIDDMESIAEGRNSTIYIASSLSTTKDGKRKPSRRTLLSAKRSGGSFSLVHRIDICTLLETSAREQSDKKWAQFYIEGSTNQTLDMEGMFYDRGALFLGFKSPLQSGASVILRIDRIDDVFVHGELDPDQVKIWRTIKLVTGDLFPQERISDLFYHDNALYITGNAIADKGGSLWKTDGETGALKRLRRFDGHCPEGIASGGNADTLMISFDQGNDKSSKIVFIRKDL